ncbi:MAG: hypothetical protein V4804_03255 [Pseudomonadota bacterium]|jgi:hypothetical protein
MAKRFDNLKKIPAEPAARMLANAGMVLRTPVKAPASASVTAVMDELDAAGAWLDMLDLLAIALPAREATWWACLAARDLVGHDAKKVPLSLEAAEKWVFKPTEEHRALARTALETAAIGDDTTLCAMAALYGAGTLGPDDLSDYPAPPNALALSVSAMNLKSAAHVPADMMKRAQRLIDRGVDIARGGNGRVDVDAATTGAA